MINQIIKAMETGMIPDSAIRFGIKKICRRRLDEMFTGSNQKDEEIRQAYIKNLKLLPLAIHTKEANQQHYEVPALFFQKSLGKNLKYSCSYWDAQTTSLDKAEENALNETILRAELKDGMNILELGCGWGSLTLEMARRFPNSKIVAISNSGSQKMFIDSLAHQRNLKNVIVLTRDISHLETLAVEFPAFHRVVSIEMFEHFKNYEILLSKISDALTPDGKLFVHIFTHRKYAYSFETQGDDNWMGKYFFTGGQMPSHDLLMCFQKNLNLENSWIWDGIHYEKTSNAWLENMDRNKETIMPCFQQTYGADAEIWFQRWRIFYMACAELFGYNNGQDWGVSHYLFSKK